MRCAYVGLYRVASFVALVASVAAAGCVDSVPSSERADRVADCGVEDGPHNSCITSPTVSADPDFTLVVGPASATVVPGNSTSFTVVTTRLNGSSQSVALAVSGLPNGVSGVFNPPSVTAGSNSTLTLSAALTAAGMATFTVAGTSDTTSHSATASVTVQTITPLSNAVPITNISGRFRDQQLFSIAVPAGQEDLTITFGGGTGNIDFYVRAGSPPTTTTSDCHRFFVGPTESCEVVNPAENTYYIMISGASTYASMILTATFGRDPVPAIEDGVPVPDLAGRAASETFFKLAVPPGQGQVAFTLSGGSGDADLYVRAGAKPTTTTFDCSSVIFGNNEMCAIVNPTAGPYYVMVKGNASFIGYGGVTLVGTIGPDPTPALDNSVPITDLAGAISSQTFFRLTVPPGQSQVVFAISGGSGDADLYVRAGNKPTTTAFDCRGFLAGNNETCTIANPVAGVYYVMLRGFSAYTGVSLVGHFP